MKALIVKELRSFLRGRRPFIVLSLYLLLMAAVLLLTYSSMDNGFADRSDVGVTLFSMALGLSLAELVFIAPVLSASSLGSERDRQTIDLLLITPISSIRIVLGKLVAPLIFLFMLALATLPMLGLGYMIGGLELQEFVAGFIIIATALLSFSTLGIWAAARMTTSRGGTMLGLGLAILICFLIPGFILLSGIATNGSIFRGDLVSYGVYGLLALSPFADLAFLLEARSNNTFWTNSHLIGSGDVPAAWLVSLIFWAVMIPFLLWRSSKKLRTSVAKHGGG